MWESPYMGGGCALGTVIFDANEDGVSDVACGSYEEIVVHDGTDGGILYKIPCLSYRTSSLATADIDGDGAWELFGLCNDGGREGREPAARSWDAGGAELWQTLVELPWGMHVMALSLEVADLEGDGTPEIITNRFVLDAATGERLHDLAHVPDTTTGEVKSGLVVADLDDDREQDIVSGRQAYHHDGTLLWEAGPESWADDGQMMVVASYQGSYSPLVFAFSWDGTGLVVDAEGQELASVTIEDRVLAMAPCAGDIDGDGEMEVVHVGELQVQAFELNGNEIWSIPNNDPGSGTGCTTFDFDMDGAKEVVQTHETVIRILDGASGSILWEDSDWYTNTVQDVPLVADLDGDGSVELIVTNSGGQGYGYPPLRVYRSVDRDWPPGSRIWPSATWSGTSLYVDGTIPRTPATPWSTTRVWRGQPEVLVTGSDLRVEVAAHCVASCDLDAQVQLALRLINGGPEEIHAPVSVAAYTVDEDGSRRLAEVVTLNEFVAAGHTRATVAMRLTTREALPSLVLVAGDNGTGTVVVDDCDGDNNETIWTLDECGGE